MLRTSERRHGKGASWAAVLALAPLLLLALYLLGGIPLARLGLMRDAGRGPTRLLNRLYAPLPWLHRTAPPLRRPIGWYVGLLIRLDPEGPRP